MGQKITTLAVLTLLWKKRMPMWTRMARNRISWGSELFDSDDVWFCATVLHIWIWLQRTVCASWSSPRGHGGTPWVIEVQLRVPYSPASDVVAHPRVIEYLRFALDRRGSPWNYRGPPWSSRSCPWAWRFSLELWMLQVTLRPQSGASRVHYEAMGAADSVLKYKKLILERQRNILELWSYYGIYGK